MWKYTPNLLIFLDILKYVFSVTRASTPMSQNGFPIVALPLEMLQYHDMILPYISFPPLIICLSAICLVDIAPG
jgi:hypothetical protein